MNEEDRCQLQQLQTQFNNDLECYSEELIHQHIADEFFAHDQAVLSSPTAFELAIEEVAGENHYDDLR